MVKLKPDQPDAWLPCLQLCDAANSL